MFITTDIRPSVISSSHRSCYSPGSVSSRSYDQRQIHNQNNSNKLIRKHNITCLQHTTFIQDTATSTDISRQHTATLSLLLVNNTTPYNVADDWLGVVIPQFVRRGGHRGLEMGPLSSLVLTSYRLPHSNHRPISHRFRSAPTCNGQTDRWNWSSRRRHYALRCIGRQQLKISKICNTLAQKKCLAAINEFLCLQLKAQ